MPTWVMELCTRAALARPRPWTTYGSPRHHRMAAHRGASDQPPLAECRCTCSSHTTSKRLPRLRGHLPTHTCHRYTQVCRSVAQAGRAVEQACSGIKDDGLEQGKRTSGRHIGHDWPYVEARVEIRGQSVERAPGHCSPRQRSDLQKRDVRMSDMEGASVSKRSGSTQGTA